jgi:type II secretory pathway pseudopilin PulG
VADAMRRSGIALLEVMVALALLASVISSLAGLFLLAARSNREARAATTMAVAAAQKMEQLRGLSWAFGPDGDDQADLTTNISVWPEAGGGSGLRPSPPGTLASDVAGFVDYLDADGAWVGAGSAPPRDSLYTRRWSIEPLPDSPLDTLVLRVLVTHNAAAARRQAPTASRYDALSLTTVRSRRGQ